MPFDLKVLTDIQVILITHNGKVDMAELNSARMYAAEVSKAKKINKILVDNRKVSTIFSMTEHFAFNASHQGVLPSNIKIGIVFSNKTFDYNKYVEEVAGSIGTNLKAFVDMRSAKKWLLIDS